MEATAITTRFGSRYDLMSEVGHGSFGVVHRAFDRLQGREVALKVLRPEYVERPLGSNDTVSIGGQRRQMVEEFRLHAGLRHPNIVRVQDFGFEGRTPYFTMELLEGAVPFLAGTDTLDLAGRLGRFVQLLRGLRYTHRQAMLHRDLKPENVLVTPEGEVKVLDFGLALPWEPGRAPRQEIVGTWAWMAPEVLMGRPLGWPTDLYAAGLLGFELVTGEQPIPEARDRLRPVDAYEAVTRGIVADRLDRLPEALRPVFERLLKVDPSERYASAGEVLHDLSEAYPEVVAVEGSASEEALITHARLVGRSTEMSTLTGRLGTMLAGQGGVQLVGGESGVGKSRLVDQLVVEALVLGCEVVRGDAVDGGGSPYEIWREAARWLALRLEPDAPARDQLGAMDPTLGRGSVAAWTSEDLATAFLGLLRQRERPLVVVAEDLHWASPASRELLRFLANDLRNESVLVVGTFRDDEAPDLPEVLAKPPTLHLPTLGPREVRELVRSIMGDVDDFDEIAKFVVEETQGLPLFVVEVVRELALLSGGLDEVRESRLGGFSLTDGMRTALLRKVVRLSEADRELLETAAVMGRRLEADLLEALHPDAQLASCLERATDASILRVQDETWTFHHDKMREAMVGQLRSQTSDRLRALHARIAEQVERMRPPGLARSSRLAHHWTEAADAERSLVWSEAAGLEAVDMAAPAEAMRHLGRARELIGRVRPGERRFGGLLDPLDAVRLDERTVRVARIESSMAAAAYGLGDLARSKEHARRSLGVLGFALPSTALRLVAGIATGLAAQALASLRPGSWGDADPQRKQARAASTIAHTLLTEASFYEDDAFVVVWSTVRHIRLAWPGGPSHTLAEALMLVGLLFGMTPFGDFGGRLRARARGMASAMGLDKTVAKLTNRVAVYHLGATRWEEAEQSLEEARRIALRCGDRRTLEECRGMIGLGYFFQGWYDAARTAWSECGALATQSGSRQLQGDSYLGLADAASRSGEVDLAIRTYLEGEPLLIAGFSHTETVWLHGNLALLLAERGDLQRALGHARTALGSTAGRLPLTYWMQHGLAGSAETFLRANAAHPGTVDGEYRTARLAVQIYALMFGNGEAAWSYLLGLEAIVAGRWSRAQRYLERCVEQGKAHRMPYEVTCARRELAALVSRGLIAGSDEAEAKAHVVGRPGFVDSVVGDQAMAA